jgi:3-hydroxyisobutyrate dehydrogenase-like beta-hydroxyacid dehydrogenase
MAIIGFGEAGESIAAGLVSEKKGAEVSVFDISFGQPGGESRVEAARRCGATPASDLAAATSDADIVLSTVVANVAKRVAQDAATHLKANQIYVDLNSVSPSLKRQMAELFGKSRESFVEGAVMARVGANGHRTPILLAGPRAKAASDMLNAAGMKTELIGDVVGQASANKMVRSIFMKGISALFAELLISADRYDITDRILQSLSQTFPSMNWREVASYYLGRAAVHGVRMGAEMDEVGETLRDVNLDPIMARAIGDRIAWVGSQLKGYPWPEGGPKSYEEILRALANVSAHHAVA